MVQKTIEVDNGTMNCYTLPQIVIRHDENSIFDVNSATFRDNLKNIKDN